MAVTKIWKINGWIGDCLLYIENPNKTQNPLVIGDPKLKEEEYQSLIDVIEYAEDGNKTVRERSRRKRRTRSVFGSQKKCGVNGIKCLLQRI